MTAHWDLLSADLRAVRYQAMKSVAAEVRRATRDEMDRFLGKVYPDKDVRWRGEVSAWAAFHLDEHLVSPKEAVEWAVWNVDGG